MTSASDRRAPRVTLQATTVLRWRSQNGSGSGTVSNMSHVGCYVLTHQPARLGDRIRVVLADDFPELECEVRYVDPEVGMGIAFRGVTPDIEEMLRGFLRTRAARTDAP